MKPLTLLLSPEQADTRCRALIDQTRQAGQALAALSALEVFITATAHPDEKFEPIFGDIKATLERHIATARNRVMDENLATLLPALAEQNLCDIQHVHAALSRNGFHQTVLTAVPRLSETALLAAAAWAKDWCRNAKTRAEAASGFPDALDLRGAGIAPGLYAAMTELNNYLQEAVN